MTLECYMLQNPHYDVTQYAASCYTNISLSFPFSNTQFAVISPVRYCVLWPHKTVNKHSLLYFNLHVSKQQFGKESSMNKPE